LKRALGASILDGAKIERKNTMKLSMKRILAVFTAAALLSVCAPFAFATDPTVQGNPAAPVQDGNFAGITFTDPSMFAFTFEQGDVPPVPVELQIDGYTDDDPPQHVPLDHPEDVIWYSTNTNVAVIDTTSYDPDFGTASATVEILDVVGEADIEVRYADDRTFYRVYSHIVVEAVPPTPTPVSDITVTVDGVHTNFTLSGLEVPYFTLKQVYNDPDYPDSAVLHDVTALHALLFALEKNEYPDFDPETMPWQWVPANVKITNNGAYVDTINGDANNWVYSVNGKYPGAACQYLLNPGDVEVWTFLGRQASPTNGPLK
jgi:hypothetical protein